MVQRRSLRIEKIVQDRVARLRRSGETIDGIAETLKMTVNQVRRILNLNRNNPKFDVKTKITTAEVMSYYEKGFRVADIAKFLDVTPPAVQYRIRCASRTIADTEIALEDLPSWKGGRTIDSDGRVLIFAPLHPHASKKGYVTEHKLLMEVMKQRIVVTEERIYHLDGCKYHNWPDNIFVFQASTGFDDLKRLKKEAETRGVLRESDPMNTRQRPHCPEATYTLGQTPPEMRQKLFDYISLLRPMTVTVSPRRRATVKHPKLSFETLSQWLQGSEE
jgi:uncharacterized protein (DUF433 family)